MPKTSIGCASLEAKRHIIAQGGAAGGKPMGSRACFVVNGRLVFNREFLPRSSSKAFATPLVPRRLSVGSAVWTAAAWRLAGIEKRALDAPAA
eukprot:2150863-Amphidinium_carterae.1